MENGISLNELMDTLGADSFAPTQRNALHGDPKEYPYGYEEFLSDHAVMDSYGNICAWVYPEKIINFLKKYAIRHTSWIQTSSATVDLKAANSSARASAGVLHPRVFLGRLFIRFATSFSHVWLAPFRSVPLGMN